MVMGAMCFPLIQGLYNLLNEFRYVDFYHFSFGTSFGVDTKKKKPYDDENDQDVSSTVNRSKGKIDLFL